MSEYWPGIAWLVVRLAGNAPFVGAEFAVASARRSHIDPKAIPKNLAFSVPDRASLLLAPPLVLVSRAFRPVIAALNWMTNLVLRAFKVDSKDEATSTFTLEQVAGIIEQSQREGLLVDHSGTLAGAFEFTGSHPSGRSAGCHRVWPLPLQPSRYPLAGVRRTSGRRSPSVGLVAARKRHREFARP